MIINKDTVTNCKQAVQCREEWREREWERNASIWILKVSTFACLSINYALEIDEDL